MQCTNSAQWYYHALDTTRKRWLGVASLPATTMTLKQLSKFCPFLKKNAARYQIKILQEMCPWYVAGITTINGGAWYANPACSCLKFSCTTKMIGAVQYIAPSMASVKGNLAPS